MDAERFREPADVEKLSADVVVLPMPPLAPMLTGPMLNPNPPPSDFVVAVLSVCEKPDCTSVATASWISLTARLWLVVAVVSRDILILLAVLLSWLMDRPFHIKPAAVSKLNTAAQIVLATAVLADNAFGLKLVITREVLVWTTGALTFLSLAAYVRTWVRHMTGYGTTST